jgi:hypothetical protein
MNYENLLKHGFLAKMRVFTRFLEISKMIIKKMGDQPPF